MWSAADNTVSLSAARNEVVAFQLIIEGEAAKVTLVATTLNGPGGASIPAWHFKLFREWYIWIGEKYGNLADRACMAPLGPGWYPDVAIPLTELQFRDGFSIPSKDFRTPDGSRTPQQNNQAVWVDIYVDTQVDAIVEAIEEELRRKWGGDWTCRPTGIKPL